MRVAIKYTIELDDIPTEVCRLLGEAQLPQVAQVNAIMDCVENQNMIKALNQIDEMRKQLRSVDHRLSDCASIISGYVNAVTKEETDETVEG